MQDINFQDLFLTENLITYIGNKRKLLKFIDSAVDEIKSELGIANPSMFDGFSGSGCVARLFKKYASSLWVNDLEGYSETLNLCYLANPSDLDVPSIQAQIDYLNAHKLDEQPPGFVEQNYAPHDDDAIRVGERVFYTNQNAKIIDNIRRMIDSVSVSPEFVLAPLLVAASIHNNTSGVFKGFHKKDGLGHFGGAGENALTRIKGEIRLEYPIWCERECHTTVMRGDTNKVVDLIPAVDIAYYDPPYNQHPYGSNYFMLNLINAYDNPEIQTGVSGIAQNWNRSLYNKRQEAEHAMDALLGKTKAKYIIISYNDEGIIPIARFEEILTRYGEVRKRSQTYQTYRGSKNLGKDKILKAGGSRALQVQEILWIVRV